MYEYTYLWCLPKSNVIILARYFQRNKYSEIQLYEILYLSQQKICPCRSLIKHKKKIIYDRCVHTGWMELCRWKLRSQS